MKVMNIGMTLFPVFYFRIVDRLVRVGALEFRKGIWAEGNSLNGSGNWIRFDQVSPRGRDLRCLGIHSKSVELGFGSP